MTDIDIWLPQSFQFILDSKWIFVPSLKILPPGFPDDITLTRMNRFVVVVILTSDYLNLISLHFSLSEHLCWSSWRESLDQSSCVGEILLISLGFLLLQSFCSHCRLSSLKHSLSFGLLIACVCYCALLPHCIWCVMLALYYVSIFSVCKPHCFTCPSLCLLIFAGSATESMGTLMTLSIIHAQTTTYSQFKHKHAQKSYSKVFWSSPCSPCSSTLWQVFPLLFDYCAGKSSFTLLYFSSTPL